jgi:hypothetical protein
MILIKVAQEVRERGRKRGGFVQLLQAVMVASEEAVIVGHVKPFWYLAQLFVTSLMMRNYPASVKQKNLTLLLWAV